MIILVLIITQRIIIGFLRVVGQMQICSNCVMDTSDSNISFDEFGVCDHCNLFKTRDSKTWQNSLNGKYEVKLADHIKFLKPIKQQNMIVEFIMVD